jgi:hypothetical protein
MSEDLKGAIIVALFIGAVAGSIVYIIQTLLRKP